MSPFTRRRFLTISAASVAMPAFASTALQATWRGRAMGTMVSMKLAGMSQEQAAPIFSLVEQELARLENIFSLYRTESQISRLNRDGHLAAPAGELLQVLSLSDRLHRASGGAFDPTVQPVWMALAQGQTGQELEHARNLVGWQDVEFDSASVRLRRAGQGITLNGIAQGFVTDRVTALLKARGLTDVLMDMGEIAALGRSASGEAWKVGVSDANGQIVNRLTLRDLALATSASFGTALGATGHILDPQGHAAPNHLVSVSAPQAALADGLSTALCLMQPDVGARMVQTFPDARIEVLL